MTDRRGLALGPNQFIKIGDIDYVNAYQTVAKSEDEELIDCFASMSIALRRYPVQVQDGLGKHLKDAMKDGAFFEVTNYLNHKVQDDAQGHDTTMLANAVQVFMKELSAFRETRGEGVYTRREDMPPKPTSSGAMPHVVFLNKTPSAPPCH